MLTSRGKVNRHNTLYHRTDLAITAYEKAKADAARVQELPTVGLLVL